jgi:anthranilate phosphoribosyltransferase
MFAEAIEKLSRRQDLSVDEAAGVMQEIMGGRASPVQISGLLVGLAMKGERPDEIVGIARTMRAHAVEVPGRFAPLLDLCGTGGDRAGTFNVSSVAAVVAASTGVRVAKHGNRAVSSSCGSADLFEALGVRMTATPGTIARCLDQAGIAFLFAPLFHPSMRHAAPVRRELGFRTAFNLLGPLTNPANPTHQLVGVPRPELTELVARSLLALGSERAWVVHGADGLDEISTTGYSKISECRQGTASTFYVHPTDFGLPVSSLGALAGGSVRANAEIARAVLGGARGPTRDIVVLNAGAALFVSGRAGSVRDGIAQAEGAIDCGAANATLENLARLSQAGERADPS